MIVQDALFSAEPKYCIDTNVVVSFLRGTDDEHYGADVFRPQWQFVERCMQEGKVIAPRQVEAELEKWQKSISQMHVWLRDHRYLFRDMDDAQLNAAKRIVNAYPAYGMTQNNVGDLELMTLAMARGIAVLTLEHKRSTQPSKRLPKIPDVCAEFNVDCVSLPGFLRREGFGGAGANAQ